MIFGCRSIFGTDRVPMDCGALRAHRAAISIVSSGSTGGYPRIREQIGAPAGPRNAQFPIERRPVKLIRDASLYRLQWPFAGRFDSNLLSPAVGR